LRRSTPVSAALLAALVAVLGLHHGPAPARAGQTPALTSPLPAAGALVDAGTVGVAVTVDTVDAPGQTTLTVDGVALDHHAEGDRPRRLLATAELAPGSHVAEASVTDAADRTVRRAWRFEVSGVAVRRLAGPDRFATAVALSAQQFAAAGSASTVVLARADDFADALGGVPLAVRLDGPVLLTPSEGLPDSVRDELARVLAPGGSVVVLGGAAAVGAGVESQIAALGFGLRRLAGDDRYATAAQVANALWTETATASPPAGGRTAVLVSGETFADALSASVPAALAGWPILLTRPGELPGDTAAALRGVERLVVVGGEAAVSPVVLDQARTAVPGLRGPRALERLAGPTRFDTAAAVAATLPGQATPTLVSGTAFPDALAGGAFAARLASPLVLVDTTLPPASAAALLDAAARDGAPPPSSAAGGLVVLGGTAAVSDEVVAAARRVLDDDGPPPALDPPPGTELAGLEIGTSFRIATDLAVDAGASQAQLEVDGAEVALALRAEGSALVAEVTGPPAMPAPTDRPREVRLVAAVRATGGGAVPVRHVAGAYTAPATPPVLPTAEGFARAGGDGEVVGSAGAVVRYSLEVEPATGIDVSAFAREAEALLSDPRGWSGRGERRLQRVAAGEPAIRVVLATPATVDRYCARAGLDTAGRYSCWNGAFAMINLDRWINGSPAFAAPLAEYRGYVLNHETGHGLGRGHVGCPAPGVLAPVMVQQTISTGGCLPNAWPYP